MASRSNRSATAPATSGAENDVPADTPWDASISWQRSVGPLVVSGQSVVKTLVANGGSACCDKGPMIAAPGAMISGFCTPVTVGPALENQHGSPPTGWRGIAVGSKSPPA